MGQKLIEIMYVCMNFLVIYAWDLQLEKLMFVTGNNLHVISMMYIQYVKTLCCIRRKGIVGKLFIKRM